MKLPPASWFRLRATGIALDMLGPDRAPNPGVLPKQTFEDTLHPRFAIALPAKVGRR